MQTTVKIAIGSDHNGFQYKKAIKEQLEKQGYAVEDLGQHEEGTPAPDFAMAEKVALRVASREADRGILICGSGAGMCIAANKIRGIRAVQAWDAGVARLSRQHNDANILCLPGGLIDPTLAQEIIKVWLETQFEGGRHQRRVDKIAQLEKRN